MDDGKIRQKRPLLDLDSIVLSVNDTHNEGENSIKDATVHHSIPTKKHTEHNNNNNHHHHIHKAKGRRIFV